MKKTLTVMLSLMLVLSGCLGLGGSDAEDDETVVKGLDTDGDGIPDVQDDDDDGDSWNDLDELNCQSDPLDDTSVPLDSDKDWTCDVRDFDDDNDGYPDTDEAYCGSDPLDATSVPSDMDNDGVCDRLDDDMDGDGVSNDEDYAPEDPDKWQGVSGCTDDAAFNHDETAELDDGTCFTLEDAEAAVLEAMNGLAKIEMIGPEPLGLYSNSQIHLSP